MNVFYKLIILIFYEAKQQIKVFKPIYEKRKKVFKKIPKFWSQVVSVITYLFNLKYLNKLILAIFIYLDDSLRSIFMFVSHNYLFDQVFFR